MFVGLVVYYFVLYRRKVFGRYKVMIVIIDFVEKGVIEKQLGDNKV